MVLPFIIAGIGLVTAATVGAIIADSEPSSKAKIQDMLDEMAVLKQEQEKQMQKAKHEKESMEAELAKLEIQLKIVQKRTELEAALVKEMQIKLQKKDLQKQLAA